MNIPQFVEYKTALHSTLPPMSASALEYWLSRNGVFVRAQRQGIKACFPIANCRIAGLVAIEPYFQMEYPRVPMEITKLMLLLSEEAGENEILFHLSFQTEHWHLKVPAQIATPTSVTPLISSLDSSYERALIEVHSHANMSSEFSETDNREETGFRIFAVLGKLKSQPEINARIGIYSHFYSIPASWVFELPPTLVEKA
ncbi:Mov34/MPN/PAD-1 family protein [Aerosakkonema funiforme]|uniref:Mov34/MPN/PAD-1 family protein n=1 Tax=Aerosakkonema funiforme TaxID=1246630 RepID=UPI0035B91F55